MKGAVLGWAPAVLWGAGIFWLSSQPALTLPGPGGMDKLAHFGVYAVLGLLLSHAARRTGATRSMIVAVGLLYGASDELHQSFVPGRSADPLDWVADALGVVAGISIYFYLKPGRSASRPAHR